MDSGDFTPHPHGGALVVGCAQCIDKARRDQLAAEVAAAPNRFVTIEFTVPRPFGGGKIHCKAITRLRIPSGWSEAQWEGFHFDAITDAMICALPFDSVPMEWTDAAMEHSEVDRYIVGATIPDADEPRVETPSLFEVTA